MKGTFTLALALVFAVMAALGGAPPVPADSTIAFPADYRHWTHVKSTLVESDAKAFASSAGYHHFYANAQAMEGYGTGTFPDGSTLIDDGLEAIEKDGVIAAGSRRRVAVMVRDSRRFRETQNWGFEVFPGDTREGSLLAAQMAACLACHEKAAPDLVFSQFQK